MKQTGLIITAEVTDKGLNHFSVKRASIKGEDWVENEKDDFNLVDADKWVELMVEGITTVIYNSHELKLRDSAKYLRQVIGKLEQSFIQPANVSVVKSDPKEYSDRNNSSNDTISGNYVKTAFDAVEINHRTLIESGFERYGTAIRTYNYIKGDFTVNTSLVSLTSEIFYKGDKICGLFLYMHELDTVYFEKTGEHLKF